MGTLENKIAIITGAGSGIGRACAELFVEQGARVLLAGRREAPLQELARTLGEEKASYVAVDVTRPEDNARLFEAARNKFGGCDIFIASAVRRGSPN